MVVYEPYVATKFLHWSTSGELVIMSVIGGVNTLIGPMIGAAFMLFFENVVQAEIGELWKLFMGVIFVLIVIFLPGGFVEGWQRLRKLMGRKVPSRRHNVPDSPESMRRTRTRGRTAEAGTTD
jgi:branched-chain amino acid transport system permease protein